MFSQFMNHLVWYVKPFLGIKSLQSPFFCLFAVVHVHYYFILILLITLLISACITCTCFNIFWDQKIPCLMFMCMFLRYLIAQFSLDLPTDDTYYRCMVPLLNFFSSLWKNRALLHFLDPDKFKSKDDFVQNYKNLSSFNENEVQIRPIFFSH